MRDLYRWSRVSWSAPQDVCAKTPSRLSAFVQIRVCEACVTNAKSVNDHYVATTERCMAYIRSNSWLDIPQFISSTVIPDLLQIFWVTRNIYSLHHAWKNLWYLMLSRPSQSEVVMSSKCSGLLWNTVQWLLVHFDWIIVTPKILQCPEECGWLDSLWYKLTNFSNIPLTNNQTGYGYTPAGIRSPLV